MKKYIYLIATILFVLDQLTKQLVINIIDIGSSIKIIPNFFYLTYINNDGAAWGILSGQTILLIIIAIITILYINKLIKETNKINTRNVIAYGLVLGGILGNLIDRIIYGYVIDFLDFYIFGYDFPVFNISDTAMVIGLLLIIYDILIGGEKDANNCG